MYAIVGAADNPSTGDVHYQNQQQQRPVASPRYRPGTTPQESPLRMPSSSEGTPLVTFRSMSSHHNGIY